MVAPSEHAARIIRWFMPELAPAIRVIPHPIPLPEHFSNFPSREKEREHFLVLGRLRREKCLHQLIQGYALFRESSSGDIPSLVIAGPQVEEERGTPLSYYLALRQRVRRLGLDGKVLFPGAVTGGAKEELFRRARGVCNLSLSLEESFGKTPAEALARGIPLLATRWSAFPEVVGSRGILVSPREEPYGETPSLDIAEIARAFEGLCSLPRTNFPEEEDFPWRPETVRFRYREMLGEALEEEVLPLAENLRNRGILGRTAPLNVLSEEELFECHRRDCSRRLRRMKGETYSGLPPRPRRFREFWKWLCEKAWGVFSLMKWQRRKSAPSPFLSEPPIRKNLFREEHPYLRGRSAKRMSLRSSRIACALALGERGRAAEARNVLNFLEETSLLSPLERYFPLCRRISREGFRKRLESLEGAGRPLERTVGRGRMAPPWCPDRSLSGGKEKDGRSFGPYKNGSKSFRMLRTAPE